MCQELLHFCCTGLFRTKWVLQTTLVWGRSTNLSQVLIHKEELLFAFSSSSLWELKNDQRKKQP